MKENKNQCYEILLNYSCNASCLFCSQRDYDRTKKASFNEIIKQIYKAKKDGYTKLGLSGGEPTLRSDLIKIIKTAKKIGFKFIRIQTNGILLEDYEFAKSLVEAGLTYCKFSFTSHIPELHNTLIRKALAWEKAMKGLENMKQLKVRIGNNILVNKYNIPTIEKTVEFLLYKGVSNFVIIYPIYTGSMYINRKNLGISLGECKKHFLNLIKIMEKHNLSDEILFLNVPPCFLEEHYQQAIGLSPFNTLVTSPDGKKIDLDEKSDEEKIKGKICKRCMLYERCKGVDRKYIEIFGWKDFVPLKTKDKKVEKHIEDSYLTDNEKCLIEILKKKNNIDTQTILKIAKKIPLCQDCTDGNNVINAAAKLVTKKIIKMEFKKGKYYFSLLNKL